MGVNDRVQDKKSDARAARKAKTKEKAAWIGFADVELSKVDKDALRGLQDMEGEAWELVLDLVSDGYKMTLSFDAAHTTWNMSLTGTDPTGVNAGYTLTGRGGSVKAATLSFWYKHTTILAGKWAQAAARSFGKMGTDDMG